MKTIKLDTMYEYYGGKKTTILTLAKPPSKSFLMQARIAITKLLMEHIDNPDHRAHLTDYLDVVIDWSWFSRNEEKELMLPLLLEPKNDAFILLSFCLFWSFKQSAGERVPYPWMEFRNDDLCFHLLADPFDIKKMNEDLSMIIIPIIRGKDSGLSYDYQITTTDGTMRIFFQDSVTETQLKAVETILNSFFASYNQTHEVKIHNVELPHKYRDKCVRFDVDFGGSPITAPTELIRSFQPVKGIKKIVFQ